MGKFTIRQNGYDINEVNNFLDQVISQVERMVKDIKKKDEYIKSISNIEEENKKLKEKVAQHEHLESTLNRAIIMAEKTSEQIRTAAQKESEIIITDAKRNANRIVNDALLKAEKTEMEADMLKRNVTIFKKRLRGIVEAQLEVIDDIEKIEM